MTDCYLALGSNIDPESNITKAINRLKSLPNFHMVAMSPWYETAPWGITDQPAFVNLALKGRWAGHVADLLQASLGIEASLDRIRRTKNGPRTIDIDILLFGDQQHHTEELTVPHPGLYRRDFMLVPLLDIAPDAVDPVSGKLLQTFLDDLPHRCIRAQIKASGSS
jgi:2-amino-4-hydroxy-6-hydroxymethyldihydropteridine diphosphokinase